MRGRRKIAGGFGPFSPCGDCFTTRGYRDTVSLEEQFRLAAGENSAEGAVLLHRRGRSYQVYVNDDFRDSDHGMIPGTVSFRETLEFFHWLLRVGCDGWYSWTSFRSASTGGRPFSRGSGRWSTSWRLPAASRGRSWRIT